MTTNIRNFRIAENQKKLEIVELNYDDINNIYYVEWKWTTMKQSCKKEFYKYEDAIEKYKERKQFAIMCI